MSEILYLLEPGHEVTTSEQQKKKPGGEAPLLRQFQDTTAKTHSPEIWKFLFGLPGFGGFSGRGSGVCDVDGRGDEGVGLWADG